MKSISIAFIGLLMGVAAYKTGHAPGAATTQHSMTRSGDTSGVIDSAAYVKGLLADKSKYVHNGLGVLLKDLAIPVRSY